MGSGRIHGSPCSFRLNEGHTVYLERMIGRQMYGEPFRQFKAMGGWKDLQDSVSAGFRFLKV